MPQFPFRDDALLLHNSIKDYVSKVLNIYYGKIKIILNTLFIGLRIPDKSVWYLKLSHDLLKICFCTKNVINKINFDTGSNPKNVEDDPELKNWGKELGTPTGQAGAGIKVDAHTDFL